MPTLAKYRQLTKSREFDELLRKEGRTVGAPGTRQDRAVFTRELEKSVEALRVNFEGYTSEMRWTDRVLRFPRLFEATMMFRHAIAGFHTPKRIGLPFGETSYPSNTARSLSRSSDSGHQKSCSEPRGISTKSV